MSLISTPIGISLKGLYKVSVVDSNKNVIWSQDDWQNNLILNNGMELLATTYFSDLNIIAFCGNGTRDNYIPSGNSSGSVSNGWFYLHTGSTGLQNFTSSGVAGYTNSGSVSCGDIIKFADGSIVNVTCSIGISRFSASLKETNITINTQSFTVWKTSQTTLQNVLKRAGSGITTSSYLTSPGGCGYAVSGSSGSIFYWRTYDFSSESILRNYTEIGVGPSVSQLFSRIVLPNTVSVNVGENLRLKHMLKVQCQPTESYIILNAPISGWPIAPSTNTNISQSVQAINNRTISTINADGESNKTDVSLEPAGSVSGNTVVWVSGNTQSLLPCGQYVNRGALTNGVQDYSSTLTIPYVRGSYEKYQYSLFDADQVNGKIGSFGLGTYRISFPVLVSNPYDSAQAFTVVLEQTQSKINTQRLQIYFKHTWDRVLE